MPANIFHLKKFIFAVEEDERGEIGYYDLISTAHDGDEELLIWKMIKGSGWYLPQYKVIKSAHFSPDKAKLFPKELTITVANECYDLGHSSVVVNRRTGVATITSSSRSSAKVLGEVIHLVAEYINRNVLTNFKSYAFNVRWETDHYQIHLTQSEDWSGDWTPES